MRRAGDIIWIICRESLHYLGRMKVSSPTLVVSKAESFGAETSNPVV